MGKVRILRFTGIVNMSGIIRGVIFSTALIANTLLPAISYRVAGLCCRDLWEKPERVVRIVSAMVDVNI